MFRLGDLTPPDPVPPGSARRATAADTALATAWMRAFAADIGEDPDADYAPAIARRIAHGGLHLWETGGRPVAMAGHSPLVAGQSRVSLVYTPPGLRGRGYAGAVTTAASRAAQADGARQVLLFTDLANPTSNALYQRLGYRPLDDHVELVFGPRNDAASRARDSTRPQSRAARASGGSIQLPPTQATFGRAR